MVVPLQASEGSSGTDEEEEEEESNEDALDDEVVSEVAVDAFFIVTFKDSIPGGLVGGLGSGVIRRVFRLEVQVWQESSRGTSKNEGEDEDTLGQVVFSSWLVDVSGSVGLVKSVCPNDNED